MAKKKTPEQLDDEIAAFFATPAQKSRASTARASSKGERQPLVHESTTLASPARKIGKRSGHSTKALSNGLFAVEIDRSAFDSDRGLPTGAKWRPNQVKLAEDELARGRSYRRPKDARYAVIEWTGFRGAVGRLLDWLEDAPGITRYAEIFE